MSNYLKHRGTCKEQCEKAIAEDASLTLVRGYYHDAFWGKQQHWWTVRTDGTIFDPSKLQFPDQNGEYEVFDGTIECEYCGNKIALSDAYVYFQHVYCNYTCFGHDVL